MHNGKYNNRREDEDVFSNLTVSNQYTNQQVMTPSNMDSSQLGSKQKTNRNRITTTPLYVPGHGDNFIGRPNQNTNINTNIHQALTDSA